MSIWKHADWWGAPEDRKVTLGEGGTPLVRSERIGRELGLPELWFKLEGANPRGSYKDRCAAAAVSHLLQDGKTACLGTSSGNTGAALAAYCARAGIRCTLAIVEGAPEGKLRQMLAHGARLYRIREFGASPAVNSAVFGGLRELAAQTGASLEISAFACSPRGMDGVQTLAYEIGEAMGDRAFHVFCPAGGGGLTLAVARGFGTLTARSRWFGSARVHCVQPGGNDTIATPLRNGATEARPVTSLTAISGLQVGSVIDGNAVIDECRRSGGQGHVIQDARAWDWQARLAREEGIFAEPAGAVALAGVESAVIRGELSGEEPVVCLVTGSGFKDEKSLVRMTAGKEAPLLADFGAFAAAVRRDRL